MQVAVSCGPAPDGRVDAVAHERADPAGDEVLPNRDPVGGGGSDGVQRGAQASPPPVGQVERLPQLRGGRARPVSDERGQLGPDADAVLVPLDGPYQRGLRDALNGFGGSGAFPDLAVRPLRRGGEDA
ncbi:MAG: hypothetical protein ACRDYX_13270 [Egibacteraceae bacterium]